MGYQRDMRIEKQARIRLTSCDGCRDITRTGISFCPHTCGQKMRTAHEAGLYGLDFEKLP